MVSVAAPAPRQAAAMTGADLLARLRARNLRAVARAISMIENGHPDAQALVDALAPDAGRATVLGITGVPGAGKSTLVPVLARRFAAQGRATAILAVDPTSPLTGGAILGDRIRDTALGETPIFFRSLASRGGVGGLSARLEDVVTLLDGAGFDAILIETVGTGQGDVDVTGIAQTVLLVTAPGLGDDVQAIKSGILEVADIVVVNKQDADPHNAALTAEGLRHAIGAATRAKGLRPGANPAAEGRPARWLAPVCAVSALRGGGIDELMAAAEAHRAYLAAAERLDDWRRTMLLRRFETRLRAALRAALDRRHPDALALALAAVAAGEIEPREAAERLAATLLPPERDDDDHPQGGKQE